MKLLRELHEVECLAEGEAADKKLYVTGVFMQSDVANRNNRRYASHIMEREVKRYLKEAVEANRAVGELGHPSGPTINLDRVSHKITSLKMEGKNVVGKALILDTPMGQIARGLVEGGVTLGISSRGLGSLKPGKDGILEVQEDFKLCTAGDLVADPSAPDAFLQAVMESRDWVFQDGEWKMCEIAEDIQKEVKKMSKSQIQEAQLRLVKRFLTTL